MAVTLRVVRLPHGAGLPLPSYATAGAAGLDLHAAVDTALVLAPFARAAIPTGLIVAVPSGYEGQVRARSGRALRDGLALVNAPGTIDADFRGELRVLVVNLGQVPITIQRGERIAQLVVCPIARAELVELAELEQTERGAGGFGSTGH